MDNSKTVGYTEIYKNTPMQWDVRNDYIMIRDNNMDMGNWIGCNYDNKKLEEVFNGASLSNLRKNNTGHKPKDDPDNYNKLIDIELSNCIEPSTISFDVKDEYHIWRNNKKLKCCHMFSTSFTNDNVECFPKTSQSNDESVYSATCQNKLAIDTTERTLFGEIKCNIVVSAGDFCLSCNQAGLPECVKVLSDKIADIPVNKGRLLEIDDGETFRFFADKNAKYNGVEIDANKPITCRYQNGEIKVVHFVDKQGQEHKPQESKENEQNIKKAPKDNAYETINDIINMLPLYKSKYKQEDIETQDYTWLNNLSEAIKNEKTGFTMEDLTQINNYTEKIARNFKELLDEKHPSEQEGVLNLKSNITNNLNNLKQIYAKNVQLKDIVEQVNKVSSLPNLTGGELVPFSDIEGKPCELLEKLKSAGVIDSVNNVNGKIEIKLNPAFHGTISFCGDLTSYKTRHGEVFIEKPYGNEIVIEVFEELLAQIKEHNKNKEKDKQIQFVAVPGNHEFLECCGDKDLSALTATEDAAIDESCKNITKKTSLLAKIKGLKVIAEIQKYFLEQACKNKDDIADNDYDPDYNENKILADIQLLGEDIEKLKGMKNNINECLGQVSKYVEFVQALQENKSSLFTGELEKKQKEKELYKRWKETLTQLKQKIGPLCWENSNVLLKMVFCHQNKKFRILHSFSLFTPEDYLNKDCTDKCANEETLKQKQKEVYSKAFKERHLNDEGIEKKKLPTKQCFSDNYVPTLVGHEGGMSPDGQTESVYCVDHTHELPGGLVFIVDENNYIKPYYTEKLLRDRQKKEKQLWSKTKYGDALGDGKQLKILSNKELECGREQVKINIGAEEDLLFDKKTKKPYLQKIENCVNDHQFDTAQQELDKASSLEKKYNRTLNNNIHILQASDTIKNGNNENLKTLFVSNNDNLEKTIEDYVNNKQGASNQQAVANAISSLIVKNNASSLEKYSRTFAFSQKDKRAQQVYETYKMLAELQNEINTSNQPKPNQTMIELNSIHSINTPCGCGCL